MHRYLDPKVDLVFKRLFGEHENLLRSFLNALLPLPQDAPIESLEYLTPEQVPELPGLFRNSIVDVKCRDTQGRTFIVEMQMLWSTSFEQRIVFNASQAYVKQLKPGQSYGDLKSVYALALTNSIFDRASDDYYHHYKIVNLHNPKRVIEGLEFVFIELPKFKPQEADAANTLKRMQIKWLRFMNEVGEQYPQTLENEPDVDIQAALQLVATAAYSPQELEIYHIQQDKLRIEPTFLQDAKAEGRAEGRAQAMTQIIGALHAHGMSVEQISQATGLTATEIGTYVKDLT